MGITHRMRLQVATTPFGASSIADLRTEMIRETLCVRIVQKAFFWKEGGPV